MQECIIKEDDYSVGSQDWEMAMGRKILSSPFLWGRRKKELIGKRH